MKSFGFYISSIHNLTNHNTDAILMYISLQNFQLNKKVWYTI